MRIVIFGKSYASDRKEEIRAIFSSLETYSPELLIDREFATLLHKMGVKTPEATLVADNDFEGRPGPEPRRRRHLPENSRAHRRQRDSHSRREPWPHGLPGRRTVLRNGAGHRRNHGRPLPHRRTHTAARHRWQPGGLALCP